MSLNAPVISLSTQNTLTANWWVKISKNPVNGDIKFVSLGMPLFIIMSLNKSTSIFIILLALAWKENDERKTTIVFDTHTGEIQTLKGRVKLFVETYERHDSNPETDSISFDSTGNQVRKSTSSIEMVENVHKYSYKYDTNGEKIEAISDSGEVYKYDRNGHIYELIASIKDTLGVRCEFKYNAAGDIIQCKEFDLKILSYLTTYKYNHRRLLIEEVGFKGDKFGDKPSYFVKVTYNYKSFDEKGNWTKVVEHFWNEEKTITRKITYY